MSAVFFLLLVSTNGRFSFLPDVGYVGKIQNDSDFRGSNHSSRSWICGIWLRIAWARVARRVRVARAKTAKAAKVKAWPLTAACFVFLLVSQFKIGPVNLSMG